MAKVDETTRRFWKKNIVSFFKYYPMRIKNVGTENELARQVIFQFKDGTEYENVAQMTALRLKEQYGDKASEIAFTCIPASTAIKNEKRYKQFSQRVCELCGAQNAYEHIHVIGERLETHKHRRKDANEIEKEQVIEFDSDWFKGKMVLCFDDILTSGKNFAAFGSKLEEFGANVIAGFFLGRTTYKLQ